MSEELVPGILKVLFPAGLGVLGTTTTILILLLLYPEKIEKWLEIIWGWIESLGILYKRANKQKIQHSIQTRVTGFAKKLGYSLPEFDAPAVKIDWVDEKIDKHAFMEGGKAVIRLRRQDLNNENVVTACMVYVSNILLRKTGRYLSPTQKESLELYVGYKILQEQDEEALDEFVNNWLFHGIEESNPKVDDYFNRYRTLDQAEFFIPIFLQELIYLGEKVYGRKRDDNLIQEVDGALQFLEVHALRRLGENVERPYYNGNMCRFGIMIIGRLPNIADERHDVYLRHIKEKLLPCDVETIYLIGSPKNKNFMKEVAEHMTDEFNIPFTRDYNITLLNHDGERIPIENHLIVLRRKKVQRYVT